MSVTIIHKSFIMVLKRICLVLLWLRKTFLSFSSLFMIFFFFTKYKVSWASFVSFLLFKYEFFKDKNTTKYKVTKFINSILPSSRKKSWHGPRWSATQWKQLSFVTKGYETCSFLKKDSSLWIKALKHQKRMRKDNLL